MVQRILIDAVHMDEVRIAIAEDSKLKEFDFENTSKKQIKSNIYLGKVTRVEPSLQAVFIEYGGNRQGFLPFSEIHHDYYQIPIDDKERLAAKIAEKAAQEEIEYAENEAVEESKTDSETDVDNTKNSNNSNEDDKDDKVIASSIKITESISINIDDITDDVELANEREEIAAQQKAENLHNAFSKSARKKSNSSKDATSKEEPSNNNRKLAKSVVSGEDKEIIGSFDNFDDDEDEIPKNRNNFYNQYKVQEVIKRNQIILVQVLKEERGNKGAFLTTYMSLAGRYCVLMPNTDKAGGVSRRIADYKERNRLKEIIAGLDAPKGVSVIVRTAGTDMDEDEISRDYKYLLNQWKEIRNDAVAANAPATIYEEDDIIKRSLRDLFRKNINEVIIDGNEAYKSAKAFMKIMAPDRAKDVKEHKAAKAIFAAHNIDTQLDDLYDNEVRLKSGGSIVIAQTEALVAIDVNSGKSTKGTNIEDTAVSTNIEAAAEVARQLRLRDLAGLVVIDFIDMHNVKNRRAVEKALNNALKSDRARIQTGRISIFGLMEMSRQRMHSSIIESSTHTCPQCLGSGVIRSQASTSIQLLRVIIAEAKKPNLQELIIKTSSHAAFGLLNHKRQELIDIESEYKIKISIDHDHNLEGAKYIIERIMKKNTKAKDNKSQNNVNKGNDNGKKADDSKNKKSSVKKEDEKQKGNTKKNNKDKKSQSKAKSTRSNTKKDNIKDTKKTESKGNITSDSNVQKINDNDSDNTNNTDQNNIAENKDNSRIKGLWKKITQ